MRCIYQSPEMYPILKKEKQMCNKLDMYFIPLDSVYLPVFLAS
jgi:hypothetical protein